MSDEPHPHAIGEAELREAVNVTYCRLRELDHSHIQAVFKIEQWVSDELDQALADVEAGPTG